MAIHIVDRRLNPGSKSLENRQRFLRRAKALVQGAVKKSSQDRDIKDVLEGGEVSVPIDGIDRILARAAAIDGVPASRLERHADVGCDAEISFRRRRFPCGRAAPHCHGAHAGAGATTR